jgi:hypothetical protein
MKKGTVYALKLVGGRFYVGFTRARNPHDRILTHFDPARASAWTRTFPPGADLRRWRDALIYSCGETTLEDEMIHTLYFMERFGINRVRGAQWAAPTLNKPQVVAARRAINHIMDRCQACGANDHYTAECRYHGPVCILCGGWGHTFGDCPDEQSRAK